MREDEQTLELLAARTVCLNFVSRDEIPVRKKNQRQAREFRGTSRGASRRIIINCCRGECQSRVERAWQA